MNFKNAYTIKWNECIKIITSFISIILKTFLKWLNPEFVSIIEYKVKNNLLTKCTVGNSTALGLLAHNHYFITLHSNNCIKLRIG